MKRNISSEDVADEPWPDETEHFVLLSDKFSVTGAVEPDPHDPMDTGTVVYEAGDEFPEEHMDSSTWRAFGGSRFAALNENGERLDETDENEEIDTSTVLNIWRRDKGDDDQVHTCAECGKEFATADGLNGHQSAHRDD